MTIIRPVHIKINIRVSYVRKSKKMDIHDCPCLNRELSATGLVQSAGLIEFERWLSTRRFRKQTPPTNLVHLDCGRRTMRVDKDFSINFNRAISMKVLPESSVRSAKKNAQLGYITPGCVHFNWVQSIKGEQLI